MNRNVFVFISFLLVIILLWLLNSCATIFSGSTQKVTLESNPPGAEVYVDGRNTYKTTPCQVTVDRKGVNGKKHQYTFKKEGYTEYTYFDDASFNPVTLGNLLFSNLLGIGIDWISGSIYKYDNEVMAILNLDKQKYSREENEDISLPSAQPLQHNVQYTQGNKSRSASNVLFTADSDIDRNIPEIKTKFPYRFALVIGNEDYSTYQLSLSQEVDVEFARNDAFAFKNYAIKTLGIPERNVVFLTDATRGQMSQALSKVNLLAKNAFGKAEIFFYYAGHGLPHEVTRDPYLIPVDVSGKDLESALKLTDIYKKLTEHSSKRVTVFLDACFSGGARNQGLIAARGVKIEPRETGLKGNMVVFTASSGIQSALPYREKKHGFFTYYLLKKFQETEGDLTYQELHSYLLEKVGLESVLLNDKEQNPQLNLSPSVKDEWKTWHFSE